MSSISTEYTEVNLYTTISNMKTLSISTKERFHTKLAEVFREQGKPTTEELVQFVEKKAIRWLSNYDPITK